MGAWVALRLARLWREPGERQARRLYLCGFLFLLLPLAVLPGDRLLGRLAAVG